MMSNGLMKHPMQAYAQACISAGIKLNLVGNVAASLFIFYKKIMPRQWDT